MALIVARLILLVLAINRVAPAVFPPNPAFPQELNDFLHEFQQKQDDFKCGQFIRKQRNVNSQDAEEELYLKLKETPTNDLYPYKTILEPDDYRITQKINIEKRHNNKYSSNIGMYSKILRDSINHRLDLEMNTKTIEKKKKKARKVNHIHLRHLQGDYEEVQSEDEYSDEEDSYSNKIPIKKKKTQNDFANPKTTSLIENQDKAKRSIPESLTSKLKEEAYQKAINRIAEAVLEKESALHKIQKRDFVDTLLRRKPSNNLTEIHPEDSGKITFLINGQIQSKIVDKVFKKVEKSRTFRKSFHQGLQKNRNYMGDSTFEGLDSTETQETDSLLGSISKIVRNYLQQMSSCLSLTPPFLTYLKKIVNVPTKTYEECLEAKYDNHQNDLLFHGMSRDGNTECTPEQIQNIRKSLQDLLEKYHAMSEPSQEKAREVKDLIVQHLDSLPSKKEKREFSSKKYRKLAGAMGLERLRRESEARIGEIFGQKTI